MKCAVRRSARRDLSARLAVYSTTAGAALLGAAPANATIQTISTLVLNGVPSTTGVTINFAHDFVPVNSTLTVGPFHMTLAMYNFNPGAAAVGFLCTGNTGIADVAGRQSALNLGLGANLEGRSFKTKGLAAYKGQFGGGGQFLPVGAGKQKTGYVDFKAGTGSNAIYGWLRVRVVNSARGFPGEFDVIARNGYSGIFGAWDVKSDIAADDFGAGVVVAGPEPADGSLSGLGLLALGAAGLRELRRRRRSV